MGAAYMLADSHRVTLFEAEKRLGGHARTVVAGKRGDQPVDTGFIVFNQVNYPNLVELFERLEVPVAESNMTFGVSIDGGRFEYALPKMEGLFAQRSNVAKPAFWRMVRDLSQFKVQAPLYAHDPNVTLREFLTEIGTGPWFRDYFLLPFSGAIWSTPVDRILDFPAKTMIDFFHNHALLNHKKRHQWYTVQGGSYQYVSRLEAAMTSRDVSLRLGAAVQSVRRTVAGAEVKLWGAEAEHFDEVVFATHSDDSLAMLVDPSSQERAALGAIAYQPNEIVLHADDRMMPKRRKTWASWVYTEDKDAKSDVIDLTYWMNSLQPIPMDDPMFVTLNTKRHIREELIYDQVTLRHPVFDVGAIEAQAALKAFNGTNSTWFCGAWLRNGFHEDGLASAVDVVEAIRRAGTLQVEAA